MDKRNLFRAGAALAAFCAALPALADSQIQVRRMTRDDVPLGQGQCDIRLQVDNEAEVSLRGSTLFIHTVAGREPRDDGSECNAPLPPGNVENFNFRVVDSRNDIVLLSEPSRRTNGAAVVRIRDSSGGEGRYHFRITWQMTGQRDFRNSPPERRVPGFPRDTPAGPPGFSWNNALRFSGQGRGQSSLPPYGSQRLSDVNVDIDRGGRIVVTFRTEFDRPLTFTGTITGREGLQYKADMMTDDRRLRGPMYITIDQRNDIDALTFEGTDGQLRLRVNWDRR